MESKESHGNTKKVLIWMEFNLHLKMFIGHNLQVWMKSEIRNSSLIAINKEQHYIVGAINNKYCNNCHESFELPLSLPEYRTI